jgi:hypothetical protein
MENTNFQERLESHNEGFLFNYPTKLSAQATQMLDTLNDASSNGRHFNVAQVPDAVNDFLVELLDAKMVEIDQLGTGTLIVTDTGRDACTKRIGLVYPEGPYGSVGTFTANLRTRTPNAQNACIRSWSNNIKQAFPTEIPQRTLDEFFKNLAEFGINRRLSRGMNHTMYDLFLNSMGHYYGDARRAKPKLVANQIKDTLSWWEIMVNNYIVSLVDNLRVVRLREVLNLSGNQIEKLSINGDQVIATIINDDCETEEVDFFGMNLDLDEKVLLLEKIG